ncbi:MBOAT family protein [Flammeovirga yaeyamensis]|uniref:MBOAT family protein n=1 Tax=Flammeovirga yaeyamensis TaxID=367791 RepID=A0AAX1N8B9_9BACT|nr:MBOAT family O-acyltransferase [Flammeovirga yaeyamensis]MBB3698807.1 D-alanyl-lipoteichoic acid acyltransferase DltB (MBOAT superfamily) [Flammeovirga yaeyamensis]NMF37392.1 MBOAT family protein [Flammeovirga yaeyamensis]QWG03794.1 MBOAT family protein [Flammeovirga yaeyamensis]
MLELVTYHENSPLLFTQVLFWVLFGSIILIYQFIYKNITTRNVLLLLASLYFYYMSSGFYFVLLLFSTIIDYYIGKKIFDSNDKKTRKLLVSISAVINLSLLAYFKYTFFFTDGLNTLFNLEIEQENYLAAFFNSLFDAGMDTSNIFLPIGISFYTFQTISYSVDIYRGDIKPVDNIWDFALFVSFFPQLVAGPIVRASEFIPQIHQQYKLKESEYGHALFLIAAGLVKKIMISDYISINFVDRIFESPWSYSGFENLMATYGYAIQIYCDFSGYTDIAIGVALLLGFRLPLNFNSPYKATDITDFWRRWHISLSSFLRDYLYIPLGGNRKGKVRTYINLFITMLLGGLWHGAHFRFIIWGCLHGGALAIHKLWMEYAGKKIGHFKYQNIIGGIITFHFVCYAWIYFRAEDMQHANSMISQILTNMDLSIALEVIMAYKYVFIVMGFGFFIHWIPQHWKDKLALEFITMPDFAKAAFLFFVGFILFQSRSSDIQPFIYFQF